MYKYLIIGIALMFTLSGSYYINKAGGGDLIEKVISGNTPTNSLPPSPESVSGVYVCSKSFGCNSKFILLLKNDMTAKIVHENEKSEMFEVLDINELDASSELDTETGFWDIGIQGMLVVTIYEHLGNEYTPAQKIVIKNIGKTMLSSINYSKNNYKNMTKPVFIRQ
ncbi:hypothetical protein K9M47_02410 [Candidatus Gracilibacteria bacterium]|nr:hypothetical protein [Candidatus Gracilibacteria bacterium]